MCPYLKFDTAARDADKPYCMKCGEEMRPNVPRMGWAGGAVHISNSSMICPQVFQAAHDAANAEDGAHWFILEQEKPAWLPMAQFIDSLVGSVEPVPAKPVMMRGQCEYCRNPIMSDHAFVREGDGSFLHIGCSAALADGDDIDNDHGDN